MPPPEASNSNTTGTKKGNLAKAQDKNFKTAIMNYSRTLKRI